MCSTAIGIILTKALTVVHGGIDECWSTIEISDSVLEPHNFGAKYGITRDHFVIIQKYLQLSVVSDEDKAKTLWWPILPFIESFNKRKISIVSVILDP